MRLSIDPRQLEDKKTAVDIMELGTVSEALTKHLPAWSEIKPIQRMGYKVNDCIKVVDGSSSSSLSLSLSLYHFLILFLPSTNNIDENISNINECSYPTSRYGDWCAPLPASYSNQSATARHTSNLINGFYWIKQLRISLSSSSTRWSGN